MTTTKPSKYRHGRFHWYEDDLFPECTRKVMTCQFGFKGHLTSHLNQNVQRYEKGELQLQVIKKIRHSHFTHETDLCRHLTCEIERVWINAKLCTTRYALHKRTLPRWLRTELYGE